MIHFCSRDRARPMLITVVLGSLLLGRPAQGAESVAAGAVGAKGGAASSAAAAPAAVASETAAGRIGPGKLSGRFGFGLGIQNYWLENYRGGMGYGMEAGALYEVAPRVHLGIDTQLLMASATTNLEAGSTSDTVQSVAPSVVAVFENKPRGGLHYQRRYAEVNLGYLWNTSPGDVHGPSLGLGAGWEILGRSIGAGFVVRLNIAYLPGHSAVGLVNFMGGRFRF